VSQPPTMLAITDIQEGRSVPHDNARVAIKRSELHVIKAACAATYVFRRPLVPMNSQWSLNEKQQSIHSWHFI
jgi:hypothetical protein